MEKKPTYEELEKRVQELEIADSERKLVEEALRKSEARLAETQHIGHIGHWEVDLVSGDVWWSDELYRIMQVDSQTKLDLENAMREFTHPDDRAFVQKVFQDAISTGELQPFEFKSITGKGEEIVLWSKGKVIKNTRGEPVKFIGINRDITERKQSEMKGRESERKLTTLVGNLPGMAYRCLNDRNWTMMFMSDGCKTVTGYEPSELIDNRELAYNDLIVDECSQYVWDEVQRSIVERRPYTLEYQIRDKHGIEKWVWERGLCVGEQNEGVLILEGFISDITERMQAEASLRENERKYRLLTEHTRDVIFRIRIPDAIFEYVSPSAMDVLGYAPDAFYKNPSLLMELLPKEWDTYFREKWAEIFNGEHPETYEFPIIHKITGETRWMIQSNVWITDNNKLIALQGRITDITDQKRAEEALIQSESRHRILVDTIPDLIWLKDENGVYLSCNSTFERFFGAKESVIVGKTDYDFVDKNLADFFRMHDRKAMKSNGASINEEWFTFADGGYVGLFETIKMPMRNVDGDLIGVLGIARNITERYNALEEKLKLERQLKQSKKMESIGTLAGGIAHDFNNILSAVIGYTELALFDTDTNTKLAENLQEIYAAGIRAKDLVQQILSFARRADEEIKPIQASSIIKEALKLIRSSLPTTIEIRQLIESDALIMADRTQIHQIIMNLCTNACQVMEDAGGVLTVELVDVLLDREFTKLHEDLNPGSYMKISVSDTGEGISSEIMDSIFEPYFTTKVPGEGTGLGLATVHGIVKNYKGEIIVNSEAGAGSTFTIYLPIAKRSATANLSLDITMPTGTERILVVDDEPAITKMNSLILNQLGYSVTIRSCSLEALELFRTKPHDYDLVITDMTMPNMTGDTLAIELLKIRSEIPIILCTGYSKKISNQTASEIGIRAFVPKPVLKKDLAKTVRKVLDEAKT